jgi:D-sedoheptulose 7-phosphate isomerase
VSFTQQFLDEAAELARGRPHATIDAIVDGLAAVREHGGRLFILGVGGGAGHASHAVNDFRKICHLESYAPTDNVSELTARINDDGWETAYAAWLRGSRINASDAVLVFSVGGGSREHGVSTNLIAALDVAREVGARIYGIVGMPDGETARVADACVVVAAPRERRTPHVEAFQAVVWHLIVSHPNLSAQTGKWESIGG